MPNTDDAQDLAKVELAEAAFPDPDEYLNDVGPLAQVYYLEQLAWSVLRNYTAMLSADVGEPPADDSEPVRALAALSEACGMIDAACVLLALLPADAQAPAAT